MEERGLFTKENQMALLEAGKRIDSSARENYNGKKEWHVLLFEEKPAEERATIWLKPNHIRIYGGKYTPLFSKLPDEPSYKYSHKERRIAFHKIEDALEFIDSKLCKKEAGLPDSINTPVEPKGLAVDGSVVVCPRCESKFKKADRCPDCGQLIKYPEG